MCRELLNEGGAHVHVELHERHAADDRKDLNLARFHCKDVVSAGLERNAVYYI